MKKNKPSEQNNPKKRKRGVHWAEDVQNYTTASPRSFLFGKKNKPPLNQDYGRIWQRIRPYIQKGDWDGLDQFLTIHQISEKDLKEFFIQKGSFIFTVAMGNDIDYFRTFVLQKMSIEHAKQILSQNDCERLTIFFSTQKYMEEKGWYTDEMKESRRKDLIFLLKIDRESVIHFFEQNQKASYMTEAAKELYQEALTALEKIKFKQSADVSGSHGVDSEKSSSSSFKKS